MSGGAVHRLSFGPFVLLRDRRTLLRDDVALPLGDRALDLLIYLVDRPGEVIAKKELIDHVWPNVTVEEGSLRVHVAAIRKALRDGQFGDRYIANVQGRGYSFVGSVVRRHYGVTLDGETSERQGHLPTRPAMVIGRDALVGEIKEGLRADRFATLLGSAGIGKTTIAVAVAHALTEETSEEVCFVDFASLNAPEHIVPALGAALGLELESDRELADLVRTRKLLVILDNCEHLIDPIAAIAEQLYQDAAQVHILATSRELLRIEGERCYHVPPLDCGFEDSEQTAEAARHCSAVRLFVDRLTVKGGCPAPKDPEILLAAEICRKLDGVPLAIELAAEQAAMLGLNNAAVRLASSTDLLRLDHRTNVGRHRTLKAALDWSFDLLADTEKIVLRRIAPFVGHFSLEDARYVAGENDWSEGRFLDAMAGLAGKSLISTRLVQGQPQYRLLNATRTYALEKLEDHAEADAIFLRHSRYTVDKIESRPPPSALTLDQGTVLWFDQPERAKSSRRAAG